MDESSKCFPNVTPLHETVVDDPSFVEACMARIAADLESRGWRLGKSIVTRSQEWGLVWRVDLLGTALLGRIRRIICWRQMSKEDIGFAFVYVDEVDKL